MEHDHDCNDYACPGCGACMYGIGMCKSEHYGER